MRDFSLPGYKYLGPGNKLNKGKARNYNDYVAYLHDIGYDTLLKEGKNPYTNWNEADEKALAQFTTSDYGGAAGKAFFYLKKKAYTMGVIGKVDPITGLKRERTPEKTPGNVKIKLNDGSPQMKTKDPLNKNETGSLSNSTPTSNMSDGDGSGNAQGTKETPVDDPYIVHRGPPDYTFSSLPYNETRRFTSVATYGVDIATRMTSPYDPMITSAVSDINTDATGVTNVWTPGATDPDATISSARWFDYYATMYKYYHVLSCRYKLYVENLGGEGLFVHVMFYNNELPPAGATNEDIMLWPSVRTKFLQPQYKGIFDTSAAIGTGAVTQTDPNTREDEANTSSASTNTYASANHVSNMIGHSSCQFTGEYRTGDFRREIVLDSQVENWTSVNANPALSERLLLRIKPENPALKNDSGQYGDRVAFKYVLQLEYLVEFKELAAELRWPVQRQPISVVLNSSTTTATA